MVDNGEAGKRVKDVTVGILKSPTRVYPWFPQRAARAREECLGSADIRFPAHTPIFIPIYLPELDSILIFSRNFSFAFGRIVFLLALFQPKDVFEIKWKAQSLKISFLKSSKFIYFENNLFLASIFKLN